MIISLFLYNILSKENENIQEALYGNWQDSMVLDETLLFFNYTYPELYPKISKLLGNSSITQYMDIIQMLESHVSKEILGLLNLSLSLRYFHPQAASIRQNVDSKKLPVLRGWAGIFKKHQFNSHSKDFHWKFLNYVYSASGSENKLKNLISVHNPFAYFSKISSTPVNSAIVDEFLRLKLHKTPISHISLINGRSVSNDPHDILDALLNEYQTIKILKELGIDIGEDPVNSLLIEKILSGRPEHEVYEYIPPLEKVPILERHEAATSRAKWGPKLNINETNPLIFLRNSRPMVKTQIFINIHSKESAPILDRILEETVTEYPYGYEVVLIGDLTNETEKRIAFSFLTCLMNIGTRSSIEYLLDAILHGYEKAYKKTRPVFPWKELLDEPANSTIYKFVKKQHDYAAKYGIKDFAIIVNGQIIRDKPSFTEMKYHILNQGKRFLDSAQRGLFSENTNIDEFLMGNGIPVNTVEKTLSIEMNNRISIDNLPINTILEIIKFMGNKLTHKSYFKSSNNNKKTYIPVYYLSCKPPSTESLSFDSPPFAIYHSAKKKNFPDSVLKIIRDAKTVVGPLIFDRALTASELRYALYYVKLSFMEQLNDIKLTPEQILFVLFWRSSLGLRGIDRKKTPSFSSMAIIHKKSNSPITWYSIMDPFSSEYRMTIEMINHVSELNIASIFHIPSVPLDGSFNIPTERFVPVIFSDGIQKDDIEDNVMTTLETPNNWAVVKKGNNHVVEHIATYCFAFGAEKIGLNEQVKFPLKNNGYFITLLPVGEFNIIGTNEDKYYVDSLLPRPKFFTTKKNLNQKEIDKLESMSKRKNDYLNIFSYSSSYGQENFTKMMLYSMIQNTTKKIKLWCISGFTNGNPKGIKTEVLSQFWPHFLPRPKDSLAFCRAAKFALPDLIFPGEIEYALIVDQEIIFRGDISIFEKINLDEYNSSLALPLISSDSKTKSYYWNQRQNVIERFKRPFHTSAISWLNMRLWRLNNGGDLYRDLYYKISSNEYPCPEIDNSIINILQLKVQIASLPSETIYCSSYSKKEYAHKTFAILQTYNDIPGILGDEYQEIINAAVNRFDN